MPGTSDDNDWIARVLGIAVDPLPPDAPLQLRRWSAVKDIWFQASSRVDQQISALQVALRASDDPEYQEIADLGLQGVTGNFKVPLMAALHDIDRAGGAPDAGAVRKLRQIIGGFIDHLANDPRVEAVDDNDLGVPVDVAVR